jgi:hypothetical protein
MQFGRAFFRSSKFKTQPFHAPAQQAAQFSGKLLEVDERMTRKYLRQTVGSIASQAFSWSLVQFKGEVQGFSFGRSEDKADVICAFRRIAIQGIKKVI